MKVLTVSYRHSEKRTVNFQSAESAMEVTTQVEDGEKASDVIKSLSLVVRQLVRADVVHAIKEITAQPAQAAPAAPTQAGTGTAGRWGTPTPSAKGTKE